MRRMTLIRCGVASVLLGGVVAVGMLAAGCGGDDNGGGPGRRRWSGPTRPRCSRPRAMTAAPAAATAALGATGRRRRRRRTRRPPPCTASSFSFTRRRSRPRCASASAPWTPRTAATRAPSRSPRATRPRTRLSACPRAREAPRPTPPSTWRAGPSRSTPSIGRAGLAGQLPDAGSRGAHLRQAHWRQGALRPTPAAPPARSTGIDYWDLGALPAGTLADGTTTLLAVNGCAPGQSDTDDAPVQCPTGYDSDGGQSRHLGDEARHDDAARRRLDRRAVRVRVVSVLVRRGRQGRSVRPSPASIVTTHVHSGRGRACGRGDAGDAAVEAAAPTPVPVTVPLPGRGRASTYGNLAPDDAGAGIRASRSTARAASSSTASRPTAAPTSRPGFR